MVLTFLNGKKSKAKIKAQDTGLRNWVKHHGIKNTELQFKKTPKLDRQHLGRVGKEAGTERNSYL